jgi:hypothetical protein
MLVVRSRFISKNETKHRQQTSFLKSSIEMKDILHNLVSISNIFVIVNCAVGVILCPKKITKPLSEIETTVSEEKMMSKPIRLNGKVFLLSFITLKGQMAMKMRGLFCHQRKIQFHIELQHRFVLLLTTR